MLVIPAQFSETEYHLFVVLDDNGVERIRLHDPGEVPMDKMAPPFDKLVLRKFVLCYASPKEMKKIAELGAAKDLASIIKLLTGGFRYRPEMGDNDQGPQRFLGN